MNPTGYHLSYNPPQEKNPEVNTNAQKKDLLVWYEYPNTIFSGSLHLTVKHNSIAYTIAEFEARNRDMRITAYLDNYNLVVELN